MKIAIPLSGLLVIILHGLFVHIDNRQVGVAVLGKNQLKQIVTPTYQRIGWAEWLEWEQQKPAQ